MTNHRLEEPCKHYLGTPLECPICREDLESYVSPRFVYITEGGTHYHFIPNCPALELGQQMVIDRGGTPAPIETVAEDSVKYDRSPCKTCRKKGE